MRKLTRSSLAVAALALLAAAPVAADVAPGDVITKANADKVKDLVSPGMMWCIQHGWPLKIVETKAVTWKTAYKEATEWRAIAHHCLKQDFSWQASARNYVKAYRRVTRRTKSQVIDD